MYDDDDDDGKKEKYIDLKMKHENFWGENQLYQRFSSFFESRKEKVEKKNPFFYPQSNESLHLIYDMRLIKDKMINLDIFPLFFVSCLKA